MAPVACFLVVVRQIGSVQIAREVPQLQWQVGKIRNGTKCYSGVELINKDYGARLSDSYFVPDLIRLAVFWRRKLRCTGTHNPCDIRGCVNLQFSRGPS